eukprot:TRINITY_DN178_c0_g3_i3.p2 TRINITY_DN178_c0_g3~~TRINITY_DN178_c0_g3_i3.p2  ORF type:complete len:411 (-),score=81.65 TRINITY_DN178_c0_g3_i3:8-1240(-)
MADRVVHVTSDSEFLSLLTNAGSKLVVVDFTASWCGPCKKIAPVFSELSLSYPTVEFLKVDVDQLKATARERGVSAMPTFHFYLKGEKVHEFRGADINALKSGLESFAPPPSAVMGEGHLAVRSYQYFPSKHFRSFESTGTEQLTKIREKVFEFGGDSLSSSDIAELKALVDVLIATRFYHSSQVDEEAVPVLAKIVSFPMAKRFPSLDLLRLTLCHDSACDTLAESYHKNRSDSPLNMIFETLLDKEVSYACKLMGWRCISNMYRMGSTRQIVAERWLSLNNLIENYSYPIPKVPLRQAIVTVLLNHSNSLIEAEWSKKLVLLPLFNAVSESETDVTSLHRLLIALGNLSFGDDQFMDMARESILVVLNNAEAASEDLKPIALELRAIVDVFDPNSAAGTSSARKVLPW